MICWNGEKIKSSKLGGGPHPGFMISYLMMTEKRFSSPPPRGLTGWLMRLPVWLYRAGLGGLLGKRFLMFTHTGRKTGRKRQTVVEVVDHDPAAGVYYVVSGWGERSDWYRNVMANPRVAVQVGNHKFDATAERLAPEEGARIMLSYAREHPQALRMLAQMMNYPLDGSEESAQEFGRMIPVLAFRPVSGVSAPDKALQ